MKKIYLTSYVKCSVTGATRHIRGEDEKYILLKKTSRVEMTNRSEGNGLKICELNSNGSK